MRSSHGREHYMSLIKGGELDKAYELLAAEARAGSAGGLRTVAAILGRRFVEASRLEFAIECYKTAIAIDGANEDRYALALLFRRVDNSGVARILAEEIIRRAVDSEDEWATKARRLIQKLDDEPHSTGSCDAC